MSTDQQKHHGKGHAAFTEDEVVDYLRDDLGRPAKTADLAERYGVSDVAIRKRLKEFDDVGTMKIRNRRIWFAEYRTPTTDGYGSTIGLGIPRAGITPLASDISKGLSFLTFASLGVSIATLAAGLAISTTIVMMLLTMGLGIGAGLAYVVANEHEDVADPTFGWDDLRRTVWGSIK